MATEDPGPWPPGFERLPDEPWTGTPVGELALDYDTVERHGWYRNLDLTVEQLEDHLRDGDLLVDYSGGTGILADRLLDALGGRRVGVLIVDSSAKFLRLALEKLGSDERIAFRRIRYLKEEGRLERVDEVVGPQLLERGVDALVSTNAIHLYYDLPETVRSWHVLLRPEGRVFVQSGNIRHPDVPADEWIIDETVEEIHREALEVVRADDRFARYREHLADDAHMSAHDGLRRKYFLPVRPLEYYVDVLEAEGFEVESVLRRTIPARVEEWYEFLKVYHEGVLGWVGGAEKVTGEAPPEEVVRDRHALIRTAMERVFGGAEEFDASWTYVTCVPEA